ncbi:MAG: hypothetical protein V3T92_04680 [Anaerolineae bacterium]
MLNHTPAPFPVEDEDVVIDLLAVLQSGVIHFSGHAASVDQPSRVNG